MKLRTPFRLSLISFNCVGSRVSYMNRIAGGLDDCMMYTTTELFMMTCMPVNYHVSMLIYRLFKASAGVHCFHYYAHYSNIYYAYLNSIYDS